MTNRIPHFAAAVVLLVASHASGAPLYYDTNGSTGGTSASSTQNFTDSVWTTDSTGASPTTGYTAGSDIIFSANDGVSVGTGTQSVTVTDTESANSFTFNNGTVTLFGSGGPNLSIGAGGVTVASTINGATTFNSSLGTLTLSASEAWDNNSGQALNVNSNFTASGSTLSFGGTGSGAVNFNGQLSGGLNLTNNSTTSTVYLNNENNTFSGAITVNGGGLVFANQGSLNNNNITLSNGGVLESANEYFSTGNDTISNNITLGVGGGAVSGGVVGSYGNDAVFSGTFTGGTGLSVVNGDFITQNDGTSNVGTLNVTGPSRLLVGSAGIFGNNAVVNVASTLDFGWSNYGGTLNNTINLENGGAIENRGPGITLTNVVMPTGPATVTLGSDDVGGGSLSISSAINLTNALTLDINGANNGTSVYLNGAVSGSAALTVTATGTGYSPIFLAGNNTYNGPTTLNSVTVYPEGNGFGTSTVTSNSSTIELTGGTLVNHFIANSGNTLFNMAGNANQGISGPIELSATGAAAYFRNSGTGNLTVGNISYDSLSNNYAAFDAANGSSITLNGTYTTPAGSNETMSFGGGDYMGSEANANYYLGPNADFTNFQTNNYGGGSTISLNAGNLHIATSLFDASEFIAVVNNAGDNHTIDIDGSQTIAAYLYTQEKYGPNPIGQWTMNQETADSSVWSGYINQNSTSLIVSAVAGGRLTFTNDIGGTAPAGVIKTGDGVVVFDNVNGNDYGTYNGDSSTPSYGVTAPFAMDIQAGTLIVKSQQGYGLGNNSSPVIIEKGATFAGSTTLAPGQEVLAKDATSVIAPGDPGNPTFGIAATIGTLSLQGTAATADAAGVNALSAPDGLTMDFKLNGLGGGSDTAPNTPGVGNDFLEIGPGGMDLEGTVTINLTAMGSAPLLTGPGNYYILIQGSGDTGDWTGDPNFVINTPTGYALDTSFGNGDGYVYDTAGDTFYVELVATPEPSTYGLLGLGLVMLVAIGRYRRLGQS